MEWISVKDRIPNVEKEVILLTTLGIYIGIWYSEFTKDDSGLYTLKKETRLKGPMLLCECCDHFEKGVTITHWMPLPEPPK